MTRKRSALYQCAGTAVLRASSALPGPGLPSWPAPGGALLLLGTVDGMYAELIDDEGALHPVATKL